MKNQILAAMLILAILITLNPHATAQPQSTHPEPGRIVPALSASSPVPPADSDLIVVADGTLSA